jgi:xanthine dehydrogenase small subunit
VPVPGEGAGAPALHPVQQAMVDCHGSQCGFCTPGFVMSLWACWQLHTTAGTVPTRQQLADDLSGNLCRCTGYRPILDAGQRMFEAPTVAGDTLDRAPGSALALALAALRDERPLATAGGFHAPRTVEALALLLQQQPQARILAGATDIGLWVTKRFRDLPLLVSVGEVAQLKRIAIDGDTLRIGGAASLEAAWTALVDRWPGLRDLWLRFASPPVRSVGTMGGNVANGSPIGDSAPVLMALDARLVLRLGQRQRLVAIAAFYIDYMKNRLEPGEFVEAIEVPLDPGHSRQVRAYKVSKRFDSDISAVSAGLSIALQDGKIADVRIAFGGMAAIVRRAASAEEALRGQAWDEGSLQAAQEALANDFQPLSDMRAGSAYRLQVAQNLLRRFWLETRAAGALSECRVNVWSREVV